MGIAKVNNVAGAAVGKVNNVPVGNIAKVNDVEAAAAGQTATRWVAAHDGNGSHIFISYAPHSDRTDWTGTTVIQNTHPDSYWIAYGKDGSGNGLWATVTGSSSIEIAHDGNNDVTDGSTWTSVSSDSSNEDLMKCRTIAWGNDVWIAMGHMTNSAKELYRSTDGASWAEIDLSGVTGMNIQTVYGLATDGAGSWVFGQQSNLFASTDNGSSWAPVDSYPGGVVVDVGFTNNTWVVLDVGDPGQINTVGASAFATEMGGGSNATWGTQELTHSSGDVNTAQTGNKRTTIACGGGVVIASGLAATMALDVNGTTVSVRSSGKVMVGSGNVIGGNINTIATDGNGVWLVGSDGASGDGGDVGQSTDNGANWTQVKDDFNYEGDRKFEALRANVYLPV